jgi:hypothetical protein
MNCKEEKIAEVTVTAFTYAKGEGLGGREAGSRRMLGEDNSIPGEKVKA